MVLPASLCVTDGSPFRGSSIEEIHVDEANPYCFVSGAFLVPHNEMKLLRYFGLSEHVMIPRDYSEITECC
jgi:hypothetical protein